MNKQLINSLLTPLFVLTILSGCKSDKYDKHEGINNQSAVKKYDSQIQFHSPVSGSKYTCGEEIMIDLRFADPSFVKPDSIQIYINDEYVKKLDSLPFQTSIPTNRYPVGTLSINLTIYLGTEKDNRSASCILLSDIVPKKLNYSIVNKYPHDEGAYTQGLVYEKGSFFEGTGDYRRSSLRKVNAKTGEVIKIHRLPDDIFGEGIAVLNNQIFQVTYKSQHGYIYDKESFEIIQKIYYNFREGWGLAFNGENIIMSDGTSNLYFLDTIHFTEIDRIQVFNNVGEVIFLNELEYIDGKIFANIYGETKIMIIDPQTGKIESYLECKDLVPEKLKNSQSKVLNGIAYNPETRHLYVTGKDWPVLYEIKILD